MNTLIFVLLTIISLFIFLKLGKIKASTKQLNRENRIKWTQNQTLNEDRDSLTKALENSKPFVKKKLGQNIKLKKMPELLFFIDQQDNAI